MKKVEEVRVRRAERFYENRMKGKEDEIAEQTNASSNNRFILSVHLELFRAMILWNLCRTRN